MIDVMTDPIPEMYEEDKRKCILGLVGESMTLAHVIAERDHHFYQAVKQVISNEDVRDVYTDYTLETSRMLYTLEAKINRLSCVLFDGKENGEKKENGK